MESRPVGQTTVSVPHLLICHQSQLLSECLTASLNSTGSFDCQNMTAEKVLTASPISFDQIAVDLLLLDATMNDAHSIRVAERIRVLYPTCRILLLIAEHATDRMFEFAQIGSQGYFYEGLGLSEIRDAIQTVLGNQQYCSPQLANALMFQAGRIDHDQERSLQRSNGQLTSRQREILELIAFQQMGNKQIARQLKLSLYTVKNHVHNIIEKLGVQDRHEAAQLARRRGLLYGTNVQPGDVDATRHLR